MQENSRYAVGIDVGTTMVRCVVGHIDATTGVPTIVGVGQAPNSGMRKGTVVNLTGPAQAIDDALGEAERMSGHEVNEASMSVNGSHIISTKADGMIAVGMANHTVSGEDIARVEEVATTGKVPANREILDVVPHSYTLDGQSGIKDPLGMSGTRLEINANVVSALAPYMSNLQKTAEMATVRPTRIAPAVLAAAKSVLSERQLESGVAVIDLGGATTSVAVFEESDLQYIGIIPVGSVNITNDLAIGLKTDPEIAELVKVQHAHAIARSGDETVTVKYDKETHEFSSREVDEVVEARLEEIFDAVHKELKKAGRAGQLPSGVVLTGGGARLQGVAEFAKTHLGLAARVGKTSGYGGVAEQVDQPQFATAVGLMLVDAEGAPVGGPSDKRAKGQAGIKQASGIVKRMLAKLKP